MCAHVDFRGAHGSTLVTAVAIGSILANRYRVLRFLGEGGMGIVFEAFDQVRRRPVALKTLRLPDAESVYRLKREFRALANVEHPNLVSLHELVVDHGHCFFTMELVDGSDLFSYVRGGTATSTTSFDEVRLRQALSGLLRGLVALHESGRLHRDLKPSNIRVTPNGRVVLLDFGLAIETGVDVPDDPDSMFGTIAYMPPEQIRGDVELTEACDLYALGSVVFELLTGRTPFTGNGIRMLIEKQSNDAPRASSIADQIPPDLDALASELLARDPNQRPSSRDVVARLDASAASPSRAPQSPPRPSVVGRDRELEVLLELVGEGTPRTTRIAEVRGASGIGKSTVLAEVARRATRDHGALVLTSRCHESESVAFKGLDEFVDGLGRVLAFANRAERASFLPNDLAALTAVFPTFERVLPPRARGRRDATEGRDARVRSLGLAALREVLCRMTTVSELVLVLDDAQWVDADGARALADILLGPDAPPVVFVFARRNGFAGPLVDALQGRIAARPDACVTIDLGPLSDDVVRTIAHDALDESTWSDVVAREAKGNPFAAATLVRFLGDDRDRTIDASIRLPIDELVRRRVARLPGDARRALDLLALAGEPTDVEVLDADRTTLDLLRDRGFVRPVRSFSCELVDTAHDRIREAVIADLDPDERIERHRSLASSIERLYPEAHDRLSRHHGEAGDVERTTTHLLAAAAQARESFAFEQACVHLRAALGVSDARNRFRICAELAECLSLAGCYGEASSRWIDASEVASGRKREDCRRRAAESLLYAGRIDDGLALLGSVASDLGVRIPSAPAFVLWEVAKSEARLFARGLHAEIRPRSSGSSIELERVRALGAIAVQYMPLDPFRGLLAVSRHLHAALDLGDLDEIGLALGMEACACAAFGWPRGAARAIAALESLDAEHGSWMARVFVPLARVFGTYLAGDRAGALAFTDAAHRAIDENPSAPSWLRSLAWYVAGFPLRFGFRLDSFDRMREFVTVREAKAGPFAELRLRNLVLPLADLQRGDPDAVVAHVERLRRELSTQRDLSNRSALENYAAMAALYRGDFRAAFEQSDSVRRDFVRQGMWRSTVPRGFVSTTIAASGLALGDRAIVARAVADFGAPKDALAQLHALHLGAMDALVRHETASATTRLESLRTLAARGSFENFEAVACFGLVELGAANAAVARRLDELVESSGIVDVDRFLRSQLPIPARTSGRSR